MKRFNYLLIILMCCLGTASFTSCLNNDDDGGVDPETYRQYLNSISGSYDGAGGDWRLNNKLYFYNDTIKGNTTAEKTDSVTTVSASFRTDSTFTIYGVPGRVLAKEFPDEYSDLKEAIEKGPMQPINGSFIFAAIGPTSYFQTFNTTVNYPSLTYGGQTHNDISIVFWGGNIGLGYYGYFNSHKMVEMNMYMAAVYEGETKLFDIFNGTSTGLVRDKALFFVRVTR